jgi:hypothetical protein
MPAETHSRRDAIDAADVIDLVDALLDEPLGSGGIRADTQLRDLGVDDVAVLHLWDAAVEELAERGAAEPDVDELLLARTVGDLAGLITEAIGGRPPGMTEPPDGAT